MKKKKVCVLNNGLGYGGTDTFVINLVNNLNTEKYDIILILSSDKETVRNLEVADYVRILYTNSLDSLKKKIIHLILLYKIMKENKIDIFQTNIDLFNGPNLLVAWLAKVPIRICHSHNTQQSKEIEKGKKLSIVLYQKIMKWLCWKFSNRKTGCSEEAMDFLFGKKWRELQRGKVIYNGISLDKFSNKIDLAKKKNELGLQDRQHILTVGRIDIQKNPIFIVEVFKKLYEKKPNVDLVWVGEGNMKAEVIERIEKYQLQNNVIFLGIRNDVADIMKCCDVFFLPSKFEGFGIVLLEAQAANMKCLTSTEVPTVVDCGGCEYMNLDDTTENWADMLKLILEKNDKLKIDREKLYKFSDSYMAEQMEGIFENDSE